MRPARHSKPQSLRPATPCTNNVTPLASSGEPSDWEPFTIWFENDKWQAIRDERAISAADIWTWCCRKPLAYEVYTKAIEGGGRDDEPDAPAIGPTLPVDQFKTLQVEFETENVELSAN